MDRREGSSMRHAVILAHPSPTSFNAAAAKAYAAAARDCGHQADLRDLYAMGFDPLLKARELPWAKDFAPGADVVAERALLAGAEVIALIYPFWFNAPPAMLKGYVERVFGFGFGYGQAEPGTRPLLGGKLLVSVSTSGAPDEWVGQTAAVEHLRADFDNHLAAVCGLTVLEHLHIGGVTPGIRPDAGREMLDGVTAMVGKHFGRARA